MRWLAMLTLGLAVLCCGPKPRAPLAAPSCVGDHHEVCESDDVGDYNCVCPE